MSYEYDTLYGEVKGLQCEVKKDDLLMVDGNFIGIAESDAAPGETVRLILRGIGINLYQMRVSREDTPNHKKEIS